MNFKEIYKNANNSIQADRALINTIYEKAEKSKKTKVINYSVFGSFAAAAAVFVLVFNTVNFNTGKVKGIDTQIANIDTKQAEQSDILSNTEKTLPKEDYKAEENITYNYTADTKLTEERTADVPKAAPEESTVFETESITDSTAQLEESDSTVYDNMKRAASGGGGGSAQAGSGIMTASLDAPETDNGLSFEFYASDEYYNYIGINPMDIAKIPNDMAFSEFYGADITTDTNGIIVNDTAIFTAFNSTMEKSIAIEVTKLTTELKNTAESNDETFKTTAFTSNGCNFSVTAFNISNEEFDTLIASMQQK